MYKLVAIDMDGTLLREDKTVSDRTKSAIKSAYAKGTKIVVASGRPLEGLSRYIEELGIYSDQDYVLSYTGSLVQNVETKEIIYKNILSGKDLHRLYDLSKEIGVNLHAFSKQGCITPKISEYSELEGKINGTPIVELNYDDISEDEAIIKVMFVDPEEQLEKAIKKIPQSFYEEYTIVRSAPFILEFLNKKSSKGAGIKALADFLGIKREEVICIGDSENDLDMIEYAGLGVAMGNAVEEVKVAADYITDTNDEDGVAKVIEKFVCHD